MCISCLYFWCVLPVPAGSRELTGVGMAVSQHSSLLGRGRVAAAPVAEAS